MGNDGPDYSNVAAGGQVNVTHPLHVEQHEDGGEDEMNVGGLSGGLSEEQLSGWAKVSGKPSTFTPSVHKTSHQNAGTDKINVAGLSGELADDQPVKAHKADHEDSGDDEINLEGLSGTPAELVVVAAIYTTDAGQNIPNTEWTIVDFGTKAHDTHNAVTIGVGWKFTAPVSGFYQLSASNMFVSTTAWEDLDSGICAVFINDVEVVRTDQKSSYGTDESVIMAVDGSVLIYLNAEDDVNVQLFQTSGGSLALYADGRYNRVSIVKFAGG